MKLGDFAPSLVLVGGLIAAAWWFGQGEKRTLLDGKPAPKPKPKQPPPPPAADKNRKPRVPSSWTTMSDAAGRILVDPRLQYAAVLQVDSWFGVDRDRVMSELRSYLQWEALDVWEDAKDLPKNHPFAADETKNQSGRFWAVGIPSVENTTWEFTRPSEIRRIYIRQVFD